MPAFVVVEADVRDPVRYEAYKKAGDAALAKHGGKFLARGGTLDHLEGAWQPKRVVIIQFPDLAAARTWYASPEYQAARKLREGAAEFSAVIVEGLP